jgi:hypothetical protein
MAKEIHRGSELRNVSETWDENERNRDSSGLPAGSGAADTPATGDNELEKIIHEEAAEYDQVNKEERILGGERATVNDDEESDTRE